MAAVIIASPNSNHPAPQPASPRRPDLRVIHGGRSSATLAMRRVFLRRRLVVGLGLLVVTAVLWMAVVGALSLVGGTSTASQTSAATAAASPAAAEEYFVQPGDTLWVIARQLPSGRRHPVAGRRARGPRRWRSATAGSADRSARPHRLTPPAMQPRAAVASPPCVARLAPRSMTRSSTRAWPTTAARFDADASAWPAAIGTPPSNATRSNLSWC